MLAGGDMCLRFDFVQGEYVATFPVRYYLADGSPSPSLMEPPGDRSRRCPCWVLLLLIFFTDEFLEITARLLTVNLGALGQ